MVMAGKILVMGATGTIGRPLVAALVAQGQDVRAASRAATPMTGAEALRFDMADASTHAPAFAGVDRAFILAPTGTMQIVESLKPLVALAAQNKVKVVLLSVFGVDADDSIPYRQVELFLEASGTPYVILRPNWFADNFHTFWRAGLAHGQIALPAGEGKTSFIDVRDIAASAAAALTTDAFDGQALVLTGPEALSYAEAAAILTTVLGKPVHYTALSDPAFISILTSAGVPEAYAGFLATIFYPVREGWTGAVTGDVERVTGKAPLSLADYARDHAADLGA
jgi:uncharacterized protein YbjT (DUF2867 family)